MINETGITLNPVSYEHSLSAIDEIMNDYLLLIKKLLYSSDFIKIIDIVELKFPNFFDKYQHFKLFLYKIQFFHYILLDVSESELNSFYEKNIFPLIKNKSSYETIKNNLLMIAKAPCIVKSRSYQQAWEECCRLFEIGIELAFTEQLYPKRSFAHFCNENNKCQRCQNKETYKNKCGKIETIEEEILRRYNTNRKKSYEYTSSSEDDKLFNNYDLFMNRVEKKCRVESNKDLSVPFESNNDMMMMEISSDEIKSRKQSDNYDFLEHSPTIDIVDSKGLKLSLTNNSLSRQSQQSQSLKKSKLKEFQFKFTKRENIDKKILRKFRKFLKEQYKKNQINVINILSNNKFWSDFVSLNLLPPFSYIIEEKEFKSFNTGYMCWVFEHPNSIELYNIFIKSNYQYLINHFETKYHLNQNDDEYNQLKTYINTLAVVFGTGQANESTTISDNTDFLFESNPKHIMSEDIEGEENYSVNRFNWNYISLHPQMPDIFNELINNNRKTLYSKSFGGKQNDSMSDESIEYGGNKEEFDSDSN